MKRIALLVCGLVLSLANTAEARRQRRSNNRTYARPVAAAPATHTVLRPTYATPATVTVPVAAASRVANGAASTPATTASYRTSATNVAAASYSTRTAQGIANLMASYNRVGHFGGNRGYEGCGCGASPAAAYRICCYGNSGMATVDVGYARSANGMWYCCRRYR
ncbi:MAG: hypothetical protein WD872_00825 [Pirellulaceae bacterium]